MALEWDFWESPDLTRLFVTGYRAMQEFCLLLHIQLQGLDHSLDQNAPPATPVTLSSCLGVSLRLVLPPVQNVSLLHGEDMNPAHVTAHLGRACGPPSVAHSLLVTGVWTPGKGGIRSPCPIHDSRRRHVE